MHQSERDQYVEAKKAWDRREYARAIKIYEELVNQGDAQALPILAGIYIRGDGVPVDYEKAEILCGRAAALGVPEAHLQMAAIWLRRNDMKRYFLSIQESANMGSLLGQYYLALCYLLGSGVPEDRARSMVLLRDASHRGHIRAKFALARSHLVRVYNPFAVVYGLVMLTSAAIQGLFISLLNPDDERVG